MNAKEKLQNILDLETEIDALESKLLEIDERILRITRCFDSEPSSQKKYFDELVINAQEIKDEINLNLRLLRQEYLEHSKLINLVSGKYRAVLRLRYICQKSWPTIARKMNYSLPHIYKLHGWALQELNRELKKQKDDSK